MNPLTESLRLCAVIFQWIILNWPNTAIGFAMRRKYMANRCACLGRSFRMLSGCSISGYHLIRVGDNSSFAQDVVIAIGPGNNELNIGDDSFIGPGCYFRNMNHRFDRLDVHIMDQGHEGSDIIIGNGVWIGARCLLLPGTVIGDHCVIAAGSVVSTAIPSYSIAAGNPARVIKKRVAQ